MRKSYALEYSQDKENWQQASVFEETPEQKEQQIVLNEPVEAQYFRLHVTDVLKEESDLSLYYQNVSVQELEVYGQLEDCFVVETPVIEARGAAERWSSQRCRSRTAFPLAVRIMMCW